MAKLKIDNFQTKVELPELEHEVLAFWDETDAFKKSVNERPAGKPYVFYDGPPFATGLPHYGHILVSTVKDVIPRYFTMKGFKVERVWGWDCHGIPIENMIEKELELKGGKKGIEELGIDKFNAACRAAILRFDKEWEKVIHRIGRWVDFKNSYKTMDMSYMESVWWAFKSLWEKGLVYEGKRVILYCPRCATPLSNFEIAMDNSYKELLGPSTIYKYKLKEMPDTYLLAWSTTPWNKLATPALAVNPDLTYVRIAQRGEFYILAESTIKILEGEFEVVEKYKGKDLEKFNFELHYDFYPERKKGEQAGVIIADTYVTDAEGTGVVTLAVYGEDDYRVMTKHNVQLVYHVDDEGKLKPEVTPWAGMFMLKVNPLVNEDLKKRRLIYKDEERLHSVPVCYRCETRLYQAPIPAWFIDVAKMKSDLLKQNENISWYPGHLKNGRFGKGIETAPDWNISRSRYWGTPMPIWKSQITNHNDQQGKFRIIGSMEELKRWAVEPEKVVGISDIHREFLDDVEVWVDDERKVKGRRIPEVFDCWVESGSMPYASIGYPFKNKELFEKTHPAQFIVEYIAQTRAWFYTLHVMSVGLFGKHTYENALTTGTILAEDGTKMSKSKKNYPDPALLFEKYGVDALRFYLMSSVVMKGENLNFSESGVREIYQNVINLFWNVVAFYRLYVKDVPPEKIAPPKNVLDLYIISKINKLIKEVTREMDEYNLVAVCRLVTSFISDLSTWYLRLSRERIKENRETQAVFGWVLAKTCLLLAPITPFICELVWQNLHDDNKSIHLHTWPKADESAIDDNLTEHMDNSVRTLVERVHAMRKNLKLKVRQPLSSLWLFGDPAKEKLRYVEYEELLKIELNIKKIEYHRLSEVVNDKEKLQTVGYDHSGTSALFYLDPTISLQLALEGEARELIRKIQDLRKSKRTNISEKITLHLPKYWQKLPVDLLNQVQSETLIEKIIWEDSGEVSIG